MVETLCKVCGAAFTPTSDEVYTVYEPKGLSAFFTGESRFDVMDCPSCSCQAVLAPRLPACEFDIAELDGADADETEPERDGNAPYVPCGPPAELNSTEQGEDWNV